MLALRPRRGRVGRRPTRRLRPRDALADVPPDKPFDMDAAVAEGGTVSKIGARRRRHRPTSARTGVTRSRATRARARALSPSPCARSTLGTTTPSAATAATAAQPVATASLAAAATALAATTTATLTAAAAAAEAATPEAAAARHHHRRLHAAAVRNDRARFAAGRFRGTTMLVARVATMVRHCERIGGGMGGSMSLTRLQNTEVSITGDRTDAMCRQARSVAAISGRGGAVDAMQTATRTEWRRSNSRWHQAKRGRDPGSARTTSDSPLSPSIERAPRGFYRDRPTFLGRRGLSTRCVLDASERCVRHAYGRRPESYSWGLVGGAKTRERPGAIRAGTRLVPWHTNGPGRPDHSRVRVPIWTMRESALLKNAACAYVYGIRLRSCRRRSGACIVKNPFEVSRAPGEGRGHNAAAAEGAGGVATLTRRIRITRASV